MSKNVTTDYKKLSMLTDSYYYIAYSGIDYNARKGFAVLFPKEENVFDPNYIYKTFYAPTEEEALKQAYTYLQSNKEESQWKL